MNSELRIYWINLRYIIGVGGWCSAADAADPAPDCSTHCSHLEPGALQSCNAAQNINFSWAVSSSDILCEILITIIF